MSIEKSNEIPANLQNQRQAEKLLSLFGKDFYKLQCK